MLCLEDKTAVCNLQHGAENLTI